MSVADINAALVANPDTKLAIVSGQLLIDLSATGALIREFGQVKVPSDPQYGQLIGDWLRSGGIDPDAPLTFWYTLIGGTRVLVEEDITHGLTLAPTGPHSFDLR